MSTTTRRSSRPTRGSSNAGASAAAPPTRKSSRQHDSPLDDSDETNTAAANDGDVDMEEKNGTDEPASATETPRRPASSEQQQQQQQSYGEDTPTRLTRLDEKSELQGLNKRLEFYILKQRERDASADAWARELANLRNKHTADLEHQKNLFENQLQTVRKNRDDLSAKLSKLEGESAHKDNLVTDLQTRLTNEHKTRSSLEARLDTIGKEHIVQQNQINDLKQKYDNIKHEYDLISTTNKDYEGDLDSTRKSHEGLTSKYHKIVQQYNDLKDEYDTLYTRHTTDIKKYDAQIHELCLETTKSAETIRSDSEGRLDALFAERAAQYDRDKNDSLRELKQSYDAKLYGYRTRLEELGHELESEKSQHRASLRNLEKERKYSEGLSSEINILSGRVSALEAALLAERTNPDLLKQLSEKNDTIKRIKQAFKRKDAEFDELMDVKIMLDMEIKAYRSLLDSEDDRLGQFKAANAQQQQQQQHQRTHHSHTSSMSHRKMASTSSTVKVEEVEQAASSAASSSSSAASSNNNMTDAATADTTNNAADSDEVPQEPAQKKRRRGGSQTPIRRKSSARSSKKQEEEAEETEVPSATAPEESKSEVSNASSSSSSSAPAAAPAKAALLFSSNDASGQYVAMTNNSGHSAALNGWSLRAQRQKFVYTFPDISLQSGGTYYVLKAGTQHPQGNEKDQSGEWTSELSWNHDGDEVAELIAPSGVVVASVVIAAKSQAMDVDQSGATSTSSKNPNANGQQCTIM